MRSLLDLGKKHAENGKLPRKERLRRLSGSELVRRAPPRRSTPYGAPPKGLTVAWTHPARPAVLHQIPGMRTAPGRHLDQSGPQMAVEASDIGGGERPRRPLRV